MKFLDKVLHNLYEESGSSKTYEEWLASQQAGTE